MSDLFAALAAPFPPERVSWRIGSTTADRKRGMALAYIDARDVMQRLDTVCSPAGWQCRYPHAGSKTVCEIGIKVGEEWIWKADGAGDSDVEAEKGALSDAFKRAAVRFGIARYLYDVPSPWVDVEAHGKSCTISERELARLAALLTGKPLPPAPAPPAVPRPPDPQRIVADLKRQVARVGTAIAFDRMKATENFRRDYLSLPPAERAAVDQVAIERRAELDQRTRFAAGT